MSMCQSETVRAFVAVTLPTEIRTFLEDLAHRLKRSGADVRWTRPQSIHLTLKFFGEVSRDSIPELSRALESVLETRAACHVTVSGAGVFPSGKRPRVVWAGVKDPANALGEIVSALEDAVAPLGFPPEKRVFRPHLTLGRVKSGRGSRDLMRAVHHLADYEGPPFWTRHIALYQSILAPSGAEYRPLAEFSLEPPD
jgi:2'-5' RNA ligase